MTIISPIKNEGYARFFLFLFAIVVAGGLIYIFEYNALVNARYMTGTLKQEITSLGVANAELKNRLYQMTNPETLQKLALASNLVIDRAPHYIESAR